MDAVDLARAGAAAGAGEILLNVIDADGTRQGFDVATEGRAGAALGAGIFHDGSCRVGDGKRYLQAHGVEVRPC